MPSPVWSGSVLPCRLSLDTCRPWRIIGAAMGSLDRQTDYWNRVANEKEFTHPLSLDRIRPLLSDTARILDYGCGYGRSCHGLWQAGFRNTVGVDISEEMIRRGRGLYPELTLEVLRSQSLPFPDGAFDAVLLFAVLTCIPADSGQKEVLSDIFRVLRPGGILYVSDYPMQADRRNEQRYAQYEKKYGMLGVFEVAGGAIVRHHTREWVRYLLSQFQEIGTDEMTVLTMNGNPARIFQWLGRKPGEGVSDTA